MGALCFGARRAELSHTDLIAARCSHCRRWKGDGVVLFSATQLRRMESGGVPLCVACIAKRRGNGLYEILMLLKVKLALPREAVLKILYFRFSRSWVEQARPLVGFHSTI